MPAAESNENEDDNCSCDIKEEEKMEFFSDQVEKEHEPRPHAADGGMTGYLFYAILVATLGSSFLFGYNIGVISPMKNVVESWMNTTDIEAFGKNNQTLNHLWTSVTSVYSMGGMIGALFTCSAAEKFGRKGGMMFSLIFAFPGAILLGMAKYSNNVWTLLIGRFIVGINAGFNSCLVPLYLSEISPCNMKGAVGSTHQLVITIGIVVAMIAGLPDLLGNEQYWSISFALVSIPAVFQAATIFWAPESPWFLLADKHSEDAALKNLKRLRGKKGNVQAEFKEMKSLAHKCGEMPKVRFQDMFTKRKYRWPLILAIMMMLSQQLTGISLFYVTQIFKGAHFSLETAAYASIGIAALNTVATVVSLLIVDKTGRKIVYIGCLSGMTVLSVLFVIFLSLLYADMSWAAYIAIGLMMLYTSLYAVGPATIPWYVVGELFPQECRGHANSIAIVCNWFGSFVMSLAFLPLFKFVKHYSFFMLTIFDIIFIWFARYYIPETNDKPCPGCIDCCCLPVSWLSYSAKK